MGARADQAIAAIAGRQHGIATAADLVRAGLTHRQIELGAKSGSPRLTTTAASSRR